MEINGVCACACMHASDCLCRPIIWTNLSLCDKNTEITRDWCEILQYVREKMRNLILYNAVAVGLHSNLSQLLMLVHGVHLVSDPVYWPMISLMFWSFRPFDNSVFSSSTDSSAFEGFSAFVLLHYITNVYYH